MATSDKRTNEQRQDDMVNKKIREGKNQSPTANNTEENYVHTGPATGETDERNKK